MRDIIVLLVAFFAFPFGMRNLTDYFAKRGAYTDFMRKQRIQYFFERQRLLEKYTAYSWRLVCSSDEFNSTLSLNSAFTREADLERKNMLSDLLLNDYGLTLEMCENFAEKKIKDLKKTLKKGVTNPDHLDAVTKLKLLKFAEYFEEGNI